MFNLDDSGYVDTLVVDVERLGKKTGWKVTLAGPAHPAALAADETLLREEMKEESERQQTVLNAVKAGREPPQKVVSIADVRRRRARMVAARVLDSGSFVYKGTNVQLNSELALEVLSNHKYEWLLDFLDNKLANKVNFMLQSSETF